MCQHATQALQLTHVPKPAFPMETVDQSRVSIQPAVISKMSPHQSIKAGAYQRAHCPAAASGSHETGKAPRALSTPCRAAAVDAAG
jgi:hypothetical protein